MKHKVIKVRLVGMIELRKYVVVLVGIIFLSFSAISQTDHWATLGMVTFDKVYDPNFGFEVEKPVVGMVPQSLNGKEIEISGFFIPLTGKTEQSHFMLSRYPESMCFFCGAAGPESAMQVFMKDDVKVAYSQDKIKVKGTLVINAIDAANLIYTLENGVLIKN